MIIWDDPLKKLGVRNLHAGYIILLGRSVQSIRWMIA
jgi:hypothetical protein